MVLGRPQFAHVSLILGRTHEALEGHGATSVAAYSEEGYLPTLCQLLTLLGWSSRMGCVFSRDYPSEFSLDRVNAAPAVFDPQKFAWPPDSTASMSAASSAVVRPFRVPLAEEGIDSSIRACTADGAREMLRFVRVHASRGRPRIAEKLARVRDWSAARRGGYNGGTMTGA